MPIYAAKTFTANVSGRALKSVKCEMCGMEYRYELVRTGFGKGTAPYFIGQTWAAERAHAAAEKNLAKRLNNDAEMVPCPKCFWVNQDLVNRYRKSQYGSISTFAIFFIIATCVAAPLVRYLTVEGHSQRATEPNTAMFYVLAGGFALSTLLLLLRYFLMHRIDPNATYPRQPTLPMGTPPALVERIDPQTQTLCLMPVPYGDDPNTQSNSIIFRIGQISLPDICCVCLEPATTTYSIPIKVDETSGFEVPVCHSCRTSLRSKWWLTLFAILVASFGLSGLAAYYFPDIKLETRWCIFFIGGFFTALISGGLIAFLTCRSMRLDTVDATRSLCKITARNPQYIAILAEQLRQSEGRDADPSSN